MPSLEILIVPHFHYDVAYLRTYEEYLPTCFENLQEALAIMEEHPEYCFLVEQAILLEEFKRRCPRDWKRLRNLAYRGRIEVASGMWVMPDMNIPDGESMIRQIKLGKGWVRENLGLDVRTAWIADCWGHHGQVPQIMLHSGFRYYAFTRGARRGLRSEFVWCGIDGSEILCHWMSQAYGPIRFPFEAEVCQRDWGEIAEASLKNLEEVLEALRPYLSGKLVLLGNGGDFVRPQASAPHIVREWRRMGLNIRFATPTEFFVAVESSRSRLPRYAGELNPLFQGTYASRIRMKQANRRLEKKLEALERLSAVMAPIVTRQYGEVLARRITELWKGVLRNQFHDLIAGTVADPAFDEAMRLYGKVEKDADKLIAAQLECLSAHVASSRRSRGLLVFNPSGFARKEVIALPSDGFELLDAQGDLVPSQRDETSAEGHKLLVEVQVPSLGWRTYAIRPRRKSTLARGFTAVGFPLRAENDFYIITFDSSGVISSLVDKASGIEFVDRERPWWGDLIYRNDYGDLYLYDRSPLDGGGFASFLSAEEKRGVYDPPADPLLATGPVCQHERRNLVEVVEEGPLRTTVRVKGNLRFWQNRVDFVEWIFVYKAHRRIDFRVDIVGRGKHYRLNVAFPANIRQGRIRHEIPFGLQIRDEREYAAQNWIDYADEEKGICLLNKGLPGNAVCHDVLALSLFRSTAMEYKGQTSQAFEEGVPHSFEFSILPFVATQPYSPWQEGEALNMPLLSLQARGLGPGEGCFLRVEPKNVALSGLYACRSGILVRLYEARGARTRATVHFLFGIGGCWEVDALESKIRKLKVHGNKVLLRLKPFQIRSLLVEQPVRDRGAAGRVRCTRRGPRSSSPVFRQ